MKHTFTSLAALQPAMLIVLAALTLLVSGCGRSGPKAHVVRGPLRVTYEVQYSDTRAGSSSGATFRELQLFDQSVLLISVDGKGGTLLPLSKLNSLDWRKE
jgi:hypothetical protein